MYVWHIVIIHLLCLAAYEDQEVIIFYTSKAHLFLLTHIMYDLQNIFQLNSFISFIHSDGSPQK